MSSKTLVRYLSRGRLAAVGALLAASQPVGAATTASVNVSATVINKCSISTEPIAFGTVDVRAQEPGVAEGRILITCTAGTSWSLAPVSADEMNSGNNALRFALYRDAAYQQPWVADIVGVGDGTAQNSPLYGRLRPGQGATVSGDYSASLVLTVVY